MVRFQAVNDPTRPLAGMSGANRERELVRICKEIKSAISDAAGPDSATTGSQWSYTASDKEATGPGPDHRCDSLFPRRGTGTSPRSMHP